MRQTLANIGLPGPPPTGACMKLEIRCIYSGHEARGPLHVLWTKLTITVLDMHEVIGRLQKVRQTD